MFSPPQKLQQWDIANADALNALRNPRDNLHAFAAASVHEWTAKFLRLFDDILVVTPPQYAGTRARAYADNAVKWLIARFDADVLVANENFIWLLCRTHTAEDAIAHIEVMLRGCCERERHARVCRLLKYMANLEPFASPRNELMRGLTTLLVPGLGEPTEAVDWLKQLKNDAMVDWFAQRVNHISLLV